MTTWQLQTAKNKLSEVIDASLSDGPQLITRHGANTAVILSYEAYQRLQKPKPSIKQVLRSASLEGLDLERDHSTNGRGTEQLPW